MRYRQFTFDELLIAEFSCPLESDLQAMWSHHNYFVYVLDGRKRWHTHSGAYDVLKGNCIFVRKGATFVEQFFDAEFCVILLFLPDEFICDALRAVAPQEFPRQETHAPVLPIETDATLEAFFHSMMSYFARMQPPDRALLELKFRELLLTATANPKNRELQAYFCSLLKGPQASTLRQVMESNFCFNLSLEEYAQLCSRSLSAFKRDFQKMYGTTPGKWLLGKRLALAGELMRNTDKTVSEVAYESGFENLSHFSRVFRSHFGAAPAAWRSRQAV